MLTLSHLSFEANGNQIIRDLSAEIEQGSFTVITGPNGGGKSTLARLIMGMAQPKEGRIVWKGQDITQLSVSERAKLGIGYAFQQPPRFKGMSVAKLLSLAHGRELSHEETCGYLSAVGLCANDYLNRDVDASLSGGEVKLVETFGQLHENKKLSILLISHQERIMNMADEIWIVENGAIKRQGKRAEILPSLMEDLPSCEYKK